LQDLVVVELYTDGMDPASEANQRMQEQRFGTVAIPHYVVVTAEDAVVRQFAGLTRNTAEFAAFLKSQPAGF
jgi:hypothetical protein